MLQPALERTVRYAALALGLLGLVCWAGHEHAEAEPIPPGTHVDVALVLAVDISLSMDRGEQQLQRRGYVEALRHPTVLYAIQSGYHRKVAIAYVEWGSAEDRHLILPWTLIHDEASAEAAASKLAAAPLNLSRATSISKAIGFARELFDAMPFAAERRVIDISGDGPNNEGGPVIVARHHALQDGIVINGLPIMIREMGFSPWSIPDLDIYYRDCVIGGAASFVLPVEDIAQLGEAIRRKLILEIAGVRPTLPKPPRMLPVSGDERTNCLIGEKLARQLWPQ